MAYWRGTTTPLKHEQEWVSQVGMRERHDYLTGSIKADKAGKAWVEQSSDGENWDVSEELSVEAAKDKGIVNVALVLPYFRLRIKNTGTEASADMTYLRASIATQAGGDS